MTSKPQLSSDILGSIGAVEGWMPEIGHPVTPRVSHLGGNRFVTTLAMRGVPFEVHENRILENLFDNDTETYSKLGRDLGGRLGYWATFTRRLVTFDRMYRFQSAIHSVFRKPLPRALRDRQVLR